MDSFKSSSLGKIFSNASINDFVYRIDFDENGDFLGTEESFTLDLAGSKTIISSVYSVSSDVAEDEIPPLPEKADKWPDFTKIFNILDF